MRDSASRQTAANPRGQERRKVVLMGAAAPTDGKRVLSATGSPEGSRPFGKVSPQGRWEFPRKPPYLVLHSRRSAMRCLILQCILSRTDGKPRRERRDYDGVCHEVQCGRSPINFATTGEQSNIRATGTLTRSGWNMTMFCRQTGA